MSWSLNEVESLARKATRGAGLNWGLVEEAGKATRWVCAAGWPGLEALAAHLIQIDGVPHAQVAPDINAPVWTARSGMLCPLATGAVICDLAQDWAKDKTVQLGQTAYPLLLVPFMVWAADRSQSGLNLSWNNVDISRVAGETGVGRTAGSDLKIAVTESVTLTPADTQAGGILTRSYRADVAPQAIEILSTFAQRTYAPETDESRLSGAGAGLTDND